MSTPSPSLSPEISQALQAISFPLDSSHKGENGKLLLIGGSQLFHAASKWSLDVASRFVDMVFYSSIASNNEHIMQAKSEFWNGIVVPRVELENYISEADCILIGPGMERSSETQELVNDLLAHYSKKKWVIDAGALQMVDPQLLTQTCVITPHKKELERLQKKIGSEYTIQDFCFQKGVTVVLKGKIDQIMLANNTISIAGGNAGMTKGGTGDVLSGLIAALYCTHDAVTACVVGSYMNKKASDALFEKVGYYYNASDLVEVLPSVFWQELQAVKEA